MTKSFIGSILSIVSFSVLAQDGYYVDALRYSNTQFGGTSRLMGIAGAGASLGADLGAVYYNPAGLGFYRKSDLSISPNIGATSAKTSYLDNSSIENKIFFAVNNVGIAISFAKDDLSQSDWRGGTLSLTQNRIANFQNNISYSGRNVENSIADALVQQSNGINYSDFDSKTGKYANTLQGLAYQSYVTNDFNFITGLPQDASKYFNYLPKNAKMIQTGNINTNGSISQWDLSYGNNYKDILYVGGGIGLYGLVYNQNKTHSEKLETNSINSMTNITLSEQLRVRGTGLNANFGIIVRPVDFIRIGLAIRTPTILWLTETYNPTISASYSFEPGYLNPPPSSVSNSYSSQSFNYSMVVPYRANGGISIFFNKYGFLSFDAEYVDYSTTTILQNDANPTSFSGANNNIQKYSNNSALNLRGGLEGRFDIFRIRGGFAYYSDPYNNVDKIDRSTKILTFGFGIKLKDYYVDLAFSRPIFSSGYQPYSVSNLGANPYATSSNTNTNIAVTVGFNF